VDNDCNPATADGSAEPQYGSPCDGPDTDLCEEGVWACDGANMYCTDNTGDNPDLCDGVDNDCNPATADGSAEPQYGCPCDGPDTDLCEEGVWACDGANMYCTDNTDDTLEICGNSIDDDCDGEVDEEECVPGR
ncbi:MAG: hypothetical protein HKN68_07885, partial [Saprospiraceae bacterium]|nr:hypothetical protein [Saprospiraceae bacterium]